MTETRTGGCLCGAVRFKTRGPVREVVFCHCSQCRRQTGLYYAATNVEDDKLSVEGEGHVTWYVSSDEARRGFCKTCGSALFWKMDKLSYTSVMAGSFDQPASLTAGIHIFCAGRAEYYTIDDGLPQYAEGSSGVVVAGSQR